MFGEALPPFSCPILKERRVSGHDSWSRWLASALARTSYSLTRSGSFGWKADASLANCEPIRRSNRFARESRDVPRQRRGSDRAKLALHLRAASKETLAHHTRTLRSDR